MVNTLCADMWCMYVFPPLVGVAIVSIVCCPSCFCRVLSRQHQMYMSWCVIHKFVSVKVFILKMIPGLKKVTNQPFYYSGLTLFLSNNSISTQDTTVSTISYPSTSYCLSCYRPCLRLCPSLCHWSHSSFHSCHHSSRCAPPCRCW